MSERKDLIQDISVIEASGILETAMDMKGAGYRFCQSCASKTDDGLEVLYSFEKDEVLKSFRIKLSDTEPELQSISQIYWSAFIYENELHDLFGIKFNNNVLDYGGHFFKISEETPWNPKAKKGGKE